MSNDSYLKCGCQACGNHIEFPTVAAGTEAICPHCGQTTLLSPDGQRKMNAGKKLWMLAGIGFVVLTVATGGFFWLRHQNQTSSPPIPAPSVETVSAPVNTSSVPPTPVVAVVEKKHKSPDDLKTGPVKLDKTKGSSLVYAVGTVTNASDFQRFGVRIELDLLDRTGKKLGTAKDYKDVIEPNHEWQYHALIIDPKTASAKVAALHEED